ncbi:MAG: type I secretion C-terminal target domain-containing protein [Alphaproteobacteria bacterium]|nr:type I secretion C-terminal target domain-containing protein [Alphaproteobacteria bacterium]
MNESGSVYWDIDLDGFGEASGWIAGGDGLLAVDLNMDGVINDHSELFGTATTDGFSILSVYDSYSDDVINVSDTNFSDLVVWIDQNSDGYSQEDEIHTLSELGITSINLNATIVNYSIQGNQITHESSFNINGQSRLIVDAWFTYDNLNTVYLGDYTLNPSVFMLPSIRGYGTLPDLSMAMSLDSGLLTLVEGLAQTDFEDLFLQSYDLEGKVEAIFFEWAGVEAVNPTSRGNYFDARKLEFLEAYVGDDFLQNGNPNPGVGAVTFLDSAFNAALTNFITQFLFQNRQTSYFEDTASYDLVIGELSGTEEINHFWAVNSTISPSAGNDVYMFSPESTVTNIVEQSNGGYDQIWLFGEDTDDISFWTSNGSQIFFSFASNPTHVLTTTYIEKVVFSDGQSIDFTSGYVTRDSSAAHTIYGSANADYLEGRGGNDSLLGGLGNDKYIWSIGDGNDDITETGGAADELVFGAGITANDVRFERSGTYDLNVYVGTEKVLLRDQLRDFILGTNVGYAVETLRLADNSTLNLVNNLTLKGTSSANTITGLADDNTLIGLGGNDSLLGGLGNDKYIWSIGDGNDDITETGGAADELVFGAGITANDVRFERSGTYDLNVYVGTEKVLLRDQLRDFILGTNVGYAVETLRLADNSTLNLVNNLTLKGTSSANTITGLADDNTLIGLGGNDSLLGGLGNDKYIWSIGDGNDDITETGGAADELVFGAGITANDVRFERSGTYDLNVYVGTEKVLLRDQLRDFILGTNVGYAVETLRLADNSTLNLVNNLTLKGTSSANTITGLADDNTLIGLGGNDSLLGGNGNDLLYGDDGNDFLNGEAGTDIASYSSATVGVTVSLALTSAQNTVGAGTDTITNTENLTGSAFNDVLTGDANANTLTGNDENDVLEGLAGNDTLDGGNGIDTASYANATAAVTVNLATTTAQNTVGAGTDTLFSIENAKGSAFNDTLTGSSGSNVIEGGAGDDTLNGAAGTDTLSYVSAGSAVTVNLATTTAQATGGAGSDTISNFENLTGSAFNDTLTGNTGNNVIEGGAGNDAINGSTGTDTASYENATAAVTVSLALTTAQNTLGAGTDTLTAMEHLRGSAFNDTLTGSSTDNTIEGGAGDDTMNAGAGSDTLLYASATTGITVSLALTTAQNTGGAGTDTISNFEKITGSAFADILTGNSAANTLDGGLGDDILDGGAGNDALNGNTGTDTVSYGSATAAVTVSLALTTAQNTLGAGSDTITNTENLTGSAFNDTLTGNTGVNILTGGAGNDTLRGGAANDTLKGGLGTDTLYGEADADMFVFEAASAFTAQDTVADFSTAQGDKLNIADLLIGYTAGQSAIDDFVTFTTAGANTNFAVDRDGTGTTYSAVTIASISGVTSLDADTLLGNGNLIAV